MHACIHADNPNVAAQHSKQHQQRGKYDNTSREGDAASMTTLRGRERERERDRQTDRQAERQQCICIRTGILTKAVNEDLTLGKFDQDASFS